MREFFINPCSGVKIDVDKDEYIEIIDVEGGQVVDFFAEVKGSSDEFLSTGVTIDCNESLRLSVGNYIYTNKYNPMLKLVLDDVGEHDLIHPCCRKEMFDFFYHNGKDHSNCLDNINGALEKAYPIIHPLNLFMYTKIEPDGRIKVLPPKSKANDKIVLKAEMDLVLGVSACSVSESSCNSGRCTAVKLIIHD